MPPLKPANVFQQRYYGKLYRMCVVQKCRFQHKYTRYQQDLIRMRELQEEYLFLSREGINGWEDVFRARQSAEQKIADIDAKRECATINRCISESTFAHMEIPLDVDVENLYMVDVPEFVGEGISYEEREDYDEVEAYKMEKSAVDVEVHRAEQIEVADALHEADVVERDPVAEEVLKEDADVITEQDLDYGVNESETVTKLYERINKSIEIVDEAYADLQNFATPDMTKERYETLTDKEKVEWLGIAECSVQDAIQKFISKLDSIGVVYRYSDDMLNEFMRLEAVAKKMQQEQKMEEEIPMGGELFKEGKKSR